MGYVRYFSFFRREVTSPAREEMGPPPARPARRSNVSTSSAEPEVPVVDFVHGVLQRLSDRLSRDRWEDRERQYRVVRSSEVSSDHSVPRPPLVELPITERYKEGTPVAWRQITRQEGTARPVPEVSRQPINEENRVRQRWAIEEEEVQRQMRRRIIPYGDARNWILKPPQVDPERITMTGLDR